MTPQDPSKLTNRQVFTLLSLVMDATQKPSADPSLWEIMKKLSLQFEETTPKTPALDKFFQKRSDDNKSPSE
jgi:hypothetical protein